MKVMLIEIKPYQSKKYLDEIKPNLKDMMSFINNLKKLDAQKLQLTRAINFIFSKDTYKERAMHSKISSQVGNIYERW